MKGPSPPSKKAKCQETKRTDDVKPKPGGSGVSSRTHSPGKSTKSRASSSQTPSRSRNSDKDCCGPSRSPPRAPRRSPLPQQKEVSVSPQRLPGPQDPPGPPSAPDPVGGGHSRVSARMNQELPSSRRSPWSCPCCSSLVISLCPLLSTL